MHELSIARGVLAAVEKHAGGRHASVVTVRLGALRQVAPGSLELWFEFAARDTVCEGARLELRLVPAVLACLDCGREWKPRQPAFRCPACASHHIEILAGDELQVESIEIEEEPSTAHV